MKLRIPYNDKIFLAEWVDTNDLNNLKEVEGAHGFIFDENHNFLIIKTKEHKGWQLPGGGYEEEDKVPLNTFLREVDEEADLEMKELTTMGYYHVLEEEMKKPFQQARFAAKLKNLKKQTIDPATGIIPERKFVSPHQFTEYFDWADKTFLIELALEKLNPKLIETYNKIRDLEYHCPESKEDKDLSCWGKHRLLKKELDSLGYTTRFRVAKFFWSKKRIPKAITSTTNDEEYHLFLEIKIADKWITLDISNDKNFPEYNEFNFLKDNKLAVFEEEILDPKKSAELEKDFKVDKYEFHKKLNSFFKIIRKTKSLKKGGWQVKVEYFKDHVIKTPLSKEEQTETITRYLKSKNKLTELEKRQNQLKIDWETGLDIIQDPKIPSDLFADATILKTRQIKQRRAEPLMEELLKLAAKNDFEKIETLIKQYFTFLEKLWSYGIHEKTFKFHSEFGLVENKIVLLDFGELTREKEVVIKQIKKGSPIKQAEEFRVPQTSKIIDIYLKKTKEFFTLQNLDKHWRNQ